MEDLEIQPWLINCNPQYRVLLATQTTVLIAMLTGASYAWTSSLFAPYLAGASVSWWDAEVALLDEPNTTVKESTRRHGEGPTMSPEAGVQPSEQHTRSSNIGVPVRRDLMGSTGAGPDDVSHSVDGTVLSEPSCSENTVKSITLFLQFYKPAMETMLKPFSFVGNG